MYDDSDMDMMDALEQNHAMDALVTNPVSQLRKDKGLSTFDDIVLWRCRAAVADAACGAEQSVLKCTLEHEKKRKLDGRLHLVAHYNDSLVSQKRPPFNGKEAIAVTQPFDASKFNFNKVGPEETIMQIIIRTGVAPQGGVWDSVEINFGASPSPACLSTSTEETLAELHPVLFNVYPLSVGHVVIPLHSDRHLPQRLTQQLLYEALLICDFTVRPDFRMLFNSLGAWASVNHLHFHGVFAKEMLYCPNNTITPLECFPIELCRYKHTGVSLAIAPLPSRSPKPSAEADKEGSVRVEYTEWWRATFGRGLVESGESVADLSVGVYEVEEWPLKAFVVQPTSLLYETRIKEMCFLQVLLLPPPPPLTVAPLPVSIPFLPQIIY
jgi:hypothetical protein